MNSIMSRTTESAARNCTRYTIYTPRAKCAQCMAMIGVGLLLCMAESKFFIRARSTSRIASDNSLVIVRTTE